jgi:hypothetical protein
LARAENRALKNGNFFIEPLLKRRAGRSRDRSQDAGMCLGPKGGPASCGGRGRAPRPGPHSPLRHSVPTLNHSAADWVRKAAPIGGRQLQGESLPCPLVLARLPWVPGLPPGCSLQGRSDFLPADVCVGMEFEGSASFPADSCVQGFGMLPAKGRVPRVFGNQLLSGRST